MSTKIAGRERDDLSGAGCLGGFRRRRRRYGQGASQPPVRHPSLQTQDPRARIRTTVSLVVVPVTVKDSAGELVTDLQQNDFRVFEDGIEQPIALFSVDAFPLSAAILIDDDLKQSTAEKVQKTLETLAGAFSASDEVSLWRFDEVPEQISEEFITDNDALLTQLKRIDLSSSFPGIGSVHHDQRPARQYGAAAGPGEGSRRGQRASQHQTHQRRDLRRRRTVAGPAARTAQDYFPDLRRAERQEQHAQATTTP